MGMPTLYALHYSPWSRKARWALDAHRVAYRYREYLPMVGEPGLRLRARSWRRVSVPTLVTADGAIGDSFAIAKYAELHGSGSPLLPADSLDEITRWNEVAERISRAGRARATRRLRDDPAALLESVPGVLGRLGPVSRLLGRSGAAFILRKYAADEIDDARATDEIRESLTAVRDALGQGSHLVGTLSYADITIALSLQFVSPAADDFIPLGPHSRPHWTDPALAAEFSDVIAWRDGLFDAHFPR